jgi:hypothetical protein
VMRVIEELNKIDPQWAEHRDIRVTQSFKGRVAYQTPSEGITPIRGEGQPSISRQQALHRRHRAS